MNNSQPLTAKSANFPRHFFPKLLLLLFCFSVCAGAAFKAIWRQPTEAANPSELYRVVEAQLRAFCERGQTADAKEVSDSWSGKFERLRSVDLQAVQRLEFGTIRQVENRAEVNLFLIRKNASVLPCAVDLVRGSEGWKVEDARLLQRDETGRFALRGLEI